MVPQRGYLVEPPGTAPGSDPLITSAFMSIVPKDAPNMRSVVGDFKGDQGQCAQSSQAAGGHSNARKISTFFNGGRSRRIDSARPAPAPR